MCGPETLLLLGGLGSLGSSLLAPKPAAPPPLPVAAPDSPRAPGATVRVGDGQDELDNTTGPTSQVTMKDTRVFGRPIGGLGKSGLSL